MDWIFDNLRVVIMLVVAVVWVVRSLGRKSEESGGVASRPVPGHSDGAQAERTRQIQEEIRRRILARQRGESAPPPIPAQESPFGPPRVMEEPEYAEEGPRAPMPTAAARARADTEQAEILAQQRLLAEQLHALRAARASGTVVHAVPTLTPSSSAAARIAAHNLDCRRALRRDLHHPSSLRRAILLKEILGAPLALQPGRDLPRR